MGRAGSARTSRAPTGAQFGQKVGPGGFRTFETCRDPSKRKVQAVRAERWMFGVGMPDRKAAAKNRSKTRRKNPGVRSRPVGRYGGDAAIIKYFKGSAGRKVYSDLGEAARACGEATGVSISSIYARLSLLMKKKAIPQLKMLIAQGKLKSTKAPVIKIVPVEQIFSPHIISLAKASHLMHSFNPEIIEAYAQMLHAKGEPFEAQRQVIGAVYLLKNSHLGRTLGDLKKEAKDFLARQGANRN